ncbi:YrdB family protein [Deinococcus sp. KNUC1210]|uniref:YrdB family protein n=1 Tax=Deinococcus sp. KNUC1210 TaxID=2917691 RepID=UPI001EF0622B|nr:YrdB family protein [Deinococcus sp. KNUC1210]ULH15049.1 YrdB family protein [Deinococcus sp. KNUC1210]
MLKAVLLTLAFVLELVMLAAVSSWGLRSGTTTALRLLLGIGAPVVFAVVWGLFLAPRANFPLSAPAHLALELLLYALAALGLATTSRPGLAALFLGLALALTLLLRVLRLGST